MSALLIPLRRHEPLPALGHGRMTLAGVFAALPKIERAMDWLTKHHVAVVGFGCTRKGPVVTVAAHPAVYILAHGRAERREQRQAGATRHETWSFATDEGVDIVWEETVCSAS